MRFLIQFIFFIFSIPLLAQVNLETHDFNLEYGLSYHSLYAVQKANGTSGRLTSSQNPYWQGSYTLRLGQLWGVRLFGGIQFLQFNDPQGGSIEGETTSLTNYGGEIIRKTGPLTKWSIYGRVQDHPLYETVSPNVYRVVPKGFYEGGIRVAVGQRRRIGFLWGLGASGFTMFPTTGGNIITETGIGAEAHAKIGWVALFGALYQIKAFYTTSQTPNAEVNFNHETLGYALQVSYSY